MPTDTTIIDRLTTKLDVATQERDAYRREFEHGLTVAMKLFQPGGKHEGVLTLGDRIIACGLQWLDAERDRLLAELQVTNALLAERQRILDAAPCPIHGPCVPHVLERLKELERLERKKGK